MKVTLIRGVLQILFALDQGPRAGYARTTSRLLKWLFSVFAHITAKANRRILALILKHDGWPLQSRYGTSASEAAFFIVQHAPFDYMERYAPLMRDAVCRHDANKKHFAMLQDRLLVNRGKKQIYGTQFTRRSSRDDFQLWPLVNPTQLHHRRARMGLSATRTGE